MNRESLYRYTGNESQVYGVRRFTLDEGNARGSRICEVTTAGGLQFDVTADCGLDIGHLRYKGFNMNYLSKNGYDHPSRLLPVADNFDHSFPGGMLYTCGLLSVGPQSHDIQGDGEFHPLHGRFHGNSATQLSSAVTEDHLVVSGEVRETEQWRHALRIRRTISAPIWGSTVTIHDELENLTPQDSQYMLLYHFNFGWPMLDEKTFLQWPHGRRVTPRTSWAAEGLAEQNVFSKPIDGEEERVYFNEDLSEPWVVLVSPTLGVKATLTWTADTLPVLSQWKSMRSGEYVVALEPSTCYTMGRDAERANGTLRTIEAFGRKTMTVSLSFSDL